MKRLRRACRRRVPVCILLLVSDVTDALSFLSDKEYEKLAGWALVLMLMVVFFWQMDILT